MSDGGDGEGGGEIGGGGDGGGDGEGDDESGGGEGHDRAAIMWKAEVSTLAMYLLAR